MNRRYTPDPVAAEEANVWEHIFQHHLIIARRRAHRRLHYAQKKK